LDLGNYYNYLFSESYLLTFDVNSVVSIYTISKKPGSGGRKQTSEVELECDVEIRIAEFMPHPNCLIAMELAKLNFHAGEEAEHFAFVLYAAT